MKKILFSLAALIGMGCFSACSNDDEAVVQDSRKGVTIRAAIAGDADARVALGDSEGGKTKVMWSLNDAFTLAVGTESYTFTTTGEGTEAEFTSTDCPQTFTTSGTITASYPANTVNYALQDGSKEKVGNYMTMTATCDVSAGDNAEDLNLSFKHHTSVVEVSLTNTDFASKAVTVILSATNLLENGSDITTTNSELKGDANGKVVAYLVVPATATGKTLVDFKIYTVCNDGIYEAALTATALEANKLYKVEKTMAKKETMGNKIAAQAVKGDFAMKDGSFLSTTALTTEQKANVAGIVFWTESEEGYATLASDKIMKKDYPNCTHGLIVSLKDVSSNTKWQSSYNYVYDFQLSDNFIDENKSLYKSIYSDFDDESVTNHVNYILGYQNTKLLMAYNEQCADTYKILPLSLLNTFTNIAPANTTGWYIPSSKELTLLCGKDVENINGTTKKQGTDNKEYINDILSRLGNSYSNQLADAHYWASTEFSVQNNYAHSFTTGYFTYQQKIYSYVNSSNNMHVRAVCAF